MKYISLILQYQHLFPQYNNTELARKIIDENGLEVNPDRMRKYIRNVKKGIWTEENQPKEEEESSEPLTKEEEILIHTHKETTYKVHNNHYLWRTKNGDIKISLDEADEMFFQYSCHGEDKSALEVRQNFNLEPWEWNSIKTRLSLYKKSHIFSPETWRRTPDDEKEEMVARKMRELLHNSHKLVAKKYGQEHIKEAKKIVDKETKYKLFTDTFKSDFLDKLPKAKEVKVKRADIKNHVIDDLVIATGDWHNGAKASDLKLTLDFNSDILRERLREMAQKVNNYGAKRVHLHLLGDFIESFTGMNHKNSWMNMEVAMQGSEVFWNTLDMMIDFLSNINNLSSIRGVSGNHDRGDSSKEIDPRGEIGLMLLEGVKRQISNTNIDMKYGFMVITHIVDNLNYIVSHGDLKASQKIKDLVINHMRHDMVNVVEKGHLHNFSIGNNSLRYIDMIVSAIFSGNEYSEGLGFANMPGFVTSHNTKYGYPAIKFEPVAKIKR